MVNNKEITLTGLDGSVVKLCMDLMTGASCIDNGPTLIEICGQPDQDIAVKESLSEILDKFDAA